MDIDKDGEKRRKGSKNMTKKEADPGEEIIEIKKDKEEIEYQNAMMQNEFDLDRIEIAEEGVKTEDRRADSQSG